MVVHICCSVDSWYFLGKIREKYPDEKLVGFFYNPNIHPESEYQTRLIDSRRSCEQLGIEWIEGPYELEKWMEQVRGQESAPEKGARCAICFDLRLHKTAELAQSLGHQSYTTTLLMSPKKDFSQLHNAAARLQEQFSPRFVIEDFRKGGGTQAQFALAKTKQAYRQNYCGCLYALGAQREAQGRLATELFEPLARKEDAGPVARLKLYKRRDALEKEGKNPRIIRQRRLHWVLLQGGLWQEGGEAIDSEILPYSSGDFELSATLEILSDQVAVLPKQPGFVVTRSFVSGLKGAGRAAAIRHKLGLAQMDLTPIFVVDELPRQKLRLCLRTRLWEETQEFLAHFQ